MHHSFEDIGLLVTRIDIGHNGVGILLLINGMPGTTFAALNAPIAKNGYFDANARKWVSSISPAYQDGDVLVRIGQKETKEDADITLYSYVLMVITWLGSKGSKLGKGEPAK